MFKRIIDASHICNVIQIKNLLQKVQYISEKLNKII